MMILSTKMGTYWEVNFEKSSTTTFVEVIFDRMFSKARLRRGLISSCAQNGEKIGR